MSPFKLQGLDLPIVKISLVGFCFSGRCSTLVHLVRRHLPVPGLWRLGILHSEKPGFVPGRFLIGIFKAPVQPRKECVVVLMSHVGNGASMWSGGLALKNADGLIQVVDSQMQMLDGNLEVLQTFHEESLRLGLPRDIPRVVQYNKRDLPNALPIQTLEAQLNPEGAPFFCTRAHEGRGVVDLLDCLLPRVQARAETGALAVLGDWDSVLQQSIGLKLEPGGDWSDPIDGYRFRFEIAKGAV